MPTKSQSVLLAGGAIGVAATILGLIPKAGDCLACIAYIAAGLLAVWHYTDQHRLTLKGGQGLGLGALAGVIAVAVASAVDFLLSSIGLKPGFMEEMQRGFESSGMDPAQMDQMVEWFSSPFAVVGIILVGFVVGAIAGGIGGLIGASVFKKGPEFPEEGTETI